MGNHKVKRIFRGRSALELDASRNCPDGLIRSSAKNKSVPLHTSNLSAVCMIRAIPMLRSSCPLTKEKRPRREERRKDLRKVGAEHNLQ